ncbi:glioma pathogenesis-related protein 1-like [Varanus komodoensis]|uniref:glioma pathogenesis-related protein 1-like n=1 Tax=Varanus komodoensis TaxID=61221 RepID=UPI001CF77F0A|nr:glioma pathogenesis-related protein 1-like [Varanus komodoensis]
MKFGWLCGLWIMLNLSDYCYTYNQRFLPDIYDKQFIQDCVDNHNDFRSKVNPSASNMHRMTWDPALAKTAKAWAKKCHFDHNIYLKIPKKVHPTFTPVGENIWIGSVPLFSVKGAITSWYDEVNHYTFQNRACSAVCGHYTQVVWATSYKVGCAVIYCSKITGSRSVSSGAYFLCNYGPAGNYPMHPYKTGNPCSECRGEKCVNNLCENAERDKLISYTNWFPDWDTSEDEPMQPPGTNPSPIPPASSPKNRSACDSYCIAVLTLRLLFILLTFGTVALLSRQYPHLFIYE